MNDEIDGLPVHVMDAVPHGLHVNIDEHLCNKKTSIENLLRDFKAEDYKSAFFLLMDFVEPSKFFSLTKKDETYLKNAFIKLYHEHFKSDDVLVELLGTLKMYKKLKLLGTCHHVYQIQEKKFCQIDIIWKTLYSICEELTDKDLEFLKQTVPGDFRPQILAAEDWFCWALQEGKYSKMDLSNLETIFINYPRCVDIIKNYKELTDFGSYDIRVPTSASDCGIALIMNYVTFDKNSGLGKRNNSDKDVSSLVELWTAFGFQTNVCTDFSCIETLKTLNYYAEMDHSNYDAFVCCILSHGQSNTVYCSDGTLIPITDLIAPFTKCSSLNKKPKLFFIQACQGTYVYQGFGKPAYQIKTANTPVTKCSDSSAPPVLCDVLIVNSSIDGFVSFRDNRGTWFIQTLCKLMMQYGDNSSIDDVMTIVNKEVGKQTANVSLDFMTCHQIVTRSTTLGKKLFLKKRIG